VRCSEMTNYFDPVGLVITVAIFSFIPFLVVTATSFLKISAVLLILRNALGLQQVPPNMVLYGISLVLSLMVMTPVLSQSIELFKSRDDQLPSKGSEIVRALEEASPPVMNFLKQNTGPEFLEAATDTAMKFHTKYGGAVPQADDFRVLLPAFVSSQLSEAFKIGIAIYLPFVIIDLAVSCILMALGMMMVSPNSISLPIKLMLFVAVDGWQKITDGLVISYL